MISNKKRKWSKNFYRLNSKMSWKSIKKALKNKNRKDRSQLMYNANQKEIRNWKKKLSCWMKTNQMILKVKRELTRTLKNIRTNKKRKHWLNRLFFLNKVQLLWESMISMLKIYSLSLNRINQIKILTMTTLIGLLQQSRHILLFRTK